MHYLPVTNKPTELYDTFTFSHHVHTQTAVLFLLLKLESRILFRKARHYALERKERTIPKDGCKGSHTDWPRLPVERAMWKQLKPLYPLFHGDGQGNTKPTSGPVSGSGTGEALEITRTSVRVEHQRATGRLTE